MKWGWLRTVLMILAAGVAGFLVAFLTITYWPHRVYIIEESKQAYDIITDLTSIFITIIAVIVALGGIVIGWLLHRSLSGQFSQQITSKLELCSDIIFTNLHKATTSLWGQLYEQFKKDDLIEAAVAEGKKAMVFADRLDEGEFWEAKLDALNNYLMSLADKGNQQDSDLKEAYKNLASFERILEKHKKDLDKINYGKSLETLYFVRWRFPLKGEDKVKAEEDFRTLQYHPDFKDWETRWDLFKTKASTP